MGLVKRLVMSGIQHNLIGFDRTVEKLHRGSRTFLCYAQNQGLFKEDSGCIAWLASCSSPRAIARSPRGSKERACQKEVKLPLETDCESVYKTCAIMSLFLLVVRGLGQNLPILLIYVSKLAAS